MLNSIATHVKATVKSIIVAFIYVIIILSATYTLLKNEITIVSNVLSMMTTTTSKKINSDIKLDLNKKQLTEYPSYGEQYATIKIPSVNIEQPVYYGSDLETLKYGVGHYAGSKFPGEGASIIYLGHNTVGMLHNLPNVHIGDTITIETVYDTFNYQITETKVVNENDAEEAPIQYEEELFMIFTCYPVTAIGHTPYRFIVYAKPI